MVGHEAPRQTLASGPRNDVSPATYNRRFGRFAAATRERPRRETPRRIEKHVAWPPASHPSQQPACQVKCRVQMRHYQLLKSRTVVRIQHVQTLSVVLSRRPAFGEFYSPFHTFREKSDYLGKEGDRCLWNPPARQRTKGRVFLRPIGKLDHPRELRTNHLRTKKGAGASPLFLELTPLNRNPSRGWAPATPGSQSCKQRCH